jgi:hypothetical protein
MHVPNACVLYMRLVHAYLALVWLMSDALTEYIFEPALL